MSDRALYAGVLPNNYLHLTHVGYVDALRRAGWSVDYLDPLAVRTADIEGYDLIIWNSVMPGRILSQIKNGQIVVLLGGAGNDLSHYPRYAHKISLATASTFYWDQPASAVTLKQLRHLYRPRVLRDYVRYERRFARFAAPRFWQALRVPLLYLPFASDPGHFHPIPGSARDYRWCFVGHLQERQLVRKLAAHSRRFRIPHALHTASRGGPFNPYDLNSVYARSVYGINEQQLLNFGRELNQRTFDLGMAGCMQITDMAYLAAPEVGPYAKFYAGKLANASDHQYARNLLESEPVYAPDEIHEYFRRNHSFEARLALISAALGVDLTRGRLSLFPRRALYNGTWFQPKVYGSERTAHAPRRSASVAYEATESRREDASPWRW
jgi:hypothetical protein